jgi:tRNA G26 N,N-dimethylase Trm1
MCASDYRKKQIKKLDKFEKEAIAKRILEYVENNKLRLIFLSTKQICKELNISHYKFKFFLEVYKSQLNNIV